MAVIEESLPITGGEVRGQPDRLVERKMIGEFILKTNVLKSKWLQAGVPLLAAGLLTIGVVPSAGASAKAMTAGAANKASDGYIAKIKTNASLHALLPASIKSKGVITVGAQLLAAPYAYMSSTQTPLGFEVNLADAVGKELGVKIKWVQFPQWDSIIPAVQTNRVNMSIAYMNDTTAREKTINFVDYLASGIVIMVKAGNPENITGPSSLCGKNVSVQAASTQEAYLNVLNATGGACASNPVTEVVIQALAEQVLNLTTGRADAYLDDNISGGYAAATEPNVVAEVPNAPIEPGPFGMGFSKGSKPLMRAVQGAMNSLMAGGKTSTYQKIFSAWGVASAEIPKATINGCTTSAYTC
jgi:polar amino acid transport system substrate-binding protein